MPRLIIFRLFGALLLVLAGACPAFAATNGEVPVGAVLRDAKMQGLSGPSRYLSDFRGMPLVINVWASWCGPCRAEMDSLQMLSQRYAGTKFNVIGISTDDYRENAQAYLKQSHVAFSTFIDERQILENMLGADRIPLTLLVDSQGRVVRKVYGAHDWVSAEALGVISQAFHLPIGAESAASR